MNGILKTGLVALTLTALAPAAGHAAPKPPAYTFTEIGSGVTHAYSGTGVNDTGQVIGTFEEVGNTFFDHAFLSGPDGVGLKALPQPSGGSAIPKGINDMGQVVVNADAAGGSPAYAYLTGLNGKGVVKLAGGPNTRANALNAQGEVTGQITLADGVTTHAFLTQPDGKGLADLGVLTLGVDTVGYGVNDGGQVIGYCSQTNGNIHAFLSGPNGGKLKDLGTLGGNYHGRFGLYEYSVGYGVNALGQVTGGSVGKTSADAFLSGPNGGKLKDLGNLQGTGGESTGEAVNDYGDVVGNSSTKSGGQEAFLYTGGKTYDLNSLIPAGTGWTMADASAISNTGLIVCHANNVNGDAGTFLLTPVK